MTVRFTKMHGAGNDFVCLDAVTEPGLAERDDLPALAIAMCDRRRGIGADGLLVITAAPRDAHAGVAMRMFNADGSESSMCGNGLRCVAKLAVDQGLAGAGVNGSLVVETAAGPMRADCHRGACGVDRVTVDMGRPVLDLASVPVDRARLAGGQGPAWRVRAEGTEHEAVFVSMGNPHAVIYTDDVAAIDLAAAGPPMENHEAFPQRMNVHFVQVLGPAEVRMRTWERGSGITGACGSGACAVCVAGVLTGRTGRRLTAHLPGGDLELEWRQQPDRVLMTGPAARVFSGEWGG